jgi:hypothetical protein
MAAIKEHDRVVLTEDLPEQGFKAGDVGTVVLIHQGGRGYEVEFCSLDGQTLDVVSVFASHVRPAAEYEIAHARRLAG